MASTIKIKNSSTAGAAPTSSDLVQGELAVNVTDKRIFTENASGTVVELGTNPSSITLPDGSASAPTLLHSGDTNTGIFFPAADTIALTTGGTERARVDSSGNLGVGTSSPSYKLDLRGTAGLGLQVYETSTTTNKRLIVTQETAYAKYEATYSSGGNAHSWWNGGTRQMDLDVNGNLGLGVTPSAWGTGKAIEVGYAGNALWTLSSGDVRLMANAYYNGTNYIYSSTNYASYYRQDSGRHIWLNAASGTAGNSITFTQAMTLDASGNLGVGKTSMTHPLDIAADSSGNGIRLTRGATTEAVVYQNSSGGTTLASTGSSAFLAFGTGTTVGSPTERMRIDSSGNLLVGTTTTSDNSGVGIKSLYSATAPYVATVGSASTNGTVAYSLYSTGGAAFRFYVGYGGTVYATSTTITGISDRRLKENIRDLDDGLSSIMALQPRKFDWKEGKGADTKNARGFIAQEFETVFPDLIDEWKDPAPEGEAPYKAVRADLIPVLVKAIQEQQAIIESLKARLDAANL